MRARLGKRIEFALLAREWKQADLARELGVRPNTISDWVNGKTEPGGTKLTRLAAALDVSEAWLKAGDVPNPPRPGADTYISVAAPIREAADLLAGVLAQIGESGAPKRDEAPIPPARVRKVAEERRRYEKSSGGRSPRQQEK